ncbi:MAG: MFS transporter [Pseudomonadota bacterium]
MRLPTLTPKTAFMALYTAQFLFLGVQLPFFAGWLDARGFSAPAIGGLMGGALVLRLLFAPFIAYRAESLGDPRLAIRAASGLLFVSSVVMLLPVPNAVVSGGAIIILFCFGLLVPLTDTAVLRADRRGQLVYGPVRGIGSASFIVASLGGGALISSYSDDMAVLAMAGAAALTLCAALLLPFETPDVETDGGVPAKPNLEKALLLFRSKSFLLMLFASGLVQGGHATYYTFSELHWSTLGYSSLLIGLLWTTGVVCEIGFLMAAKGALRRVGPARLILLGALGTAIRWPLVGLSPPLLILFFLQTLHALTFAATYIGTVEFVGRAVPEAYRTTAMTLVSTLGVGAMTGLASIVAGTLFVREAPIGAYSLMGGMGVLAILLSVALGRRWDGGLLNAVAKKEL